MLQDVREVYPDDAYNVILQTKGIYLNDDYQYDGVKVVDAPVATFDTFGVDGPETKETIQIYNYEFWTTQHLNSVPGTIIHEFAHAYMHFNPSI